MARVTGIALALGLLALDPGGAAAGAEARPPHRIVSMAPALTEILFALELGDRVVGVTRYCDYPPEATTKPKVGGYLDPSYEAIVALEPDLVLLQPEHGEVRARLEGLGLPTLVVDLRRVPDIPAAIESVGARCGVPERGTALAASLRGRLAEVAARTRNLPSPRALLVVERDLGTGTVARVWGAGPGSFYDDVLRLAGGRNVVTGGAGPYPEVSREGLIHLDPDVILDVVAELGPRGVDLGTARRDWQALGELRAVREVRVVLLEQGFMIIPGPRIAELVETVARALHPELGRSP